MVLISNLCLSYSPLIILHLDLRTQYVRFVLAFFIHADAGVKRQILSVKNFVHSVFNSIDEDAYQVLLRLDGNDH